MSAENLLVILLLGGLLGMAGQCIRVIAGIKKLYNEAVKTNTTVSDLFETHTLVISLMIGFMAGLLCVFGLWDKLTTVGSKIDREMAITILGAGYAGADFIEAFVRKSLPVSTGETAEPDNNTQHPAVG